MVKEEVGFFLEQFSELTEKEKKELATKLNVKRFNKKDYLQKIGEIPLNCFFVLKGLVREYHVIDEMEKTTEFYSESHPAIPSECFMKNTPSNTFLECLEDSLIMLGDSENEAKSIEEFPALQGIISQMAEEEWMKASKKLALFKIQSPEKRYLNFLDERKDLQNRVSDAKIASYIGVTPESLSRIKKRLLAKS